MAYQNIVRNGKTYHWLQHHGWQQTKLGKDIQPGDILVYNYGFTYEVIEIAKETKATITVAIKSTKTGEVFARKINKNKAQAVLGYERS